MKSPSVSQEATRRLGDVPAIHRVISQAECGFFFCEDCGLDTLFTVIHERAQAGSRRGLLRHVVSAVPAVQVVRDRREEEQEQQPGEEGSDHGDQGALLCFRFPGNR